MAKPEPEVTQQAPPADALPDHWVARWLPPAWQPYARLSRLDRPIGTWLLLLPGWWALALATRLTQPGAWPDWWLFLAFGIGSITMRGAGCTFNDIADRDFDGRVARTRLRPIPAGQVSLKQAWAWLVAQSLLGFVILITMNSTAILLGIASLGLVAIYPFMKRITWWPQFFLGLAFNWGAVLGYAAVTGRLDWIAGLLYLSGIIWTLGYDTIYALQDKEDDALIGVKSTARLFGSSARIWIAAFFSITILGLGGVGWLAGLDWPYWLALAVMAGHFIWQVARLRPDDSADCLTKFRANRDAGLIILIGFLLG